MLDNLNNRLYMMQFVTMFDKPMVSSQMSVTRTFLRVAGQSQKSKQKYYILKYFRSRLEDD